ncbi:hypothetical protein EDD86DRAFT_212483, partial [Gorgonomyces haynaldii]
MSRKSSRRKPKPSTSWYVGYTEDSESVEMIMKKFEELEKLQQQDQPLTEQQLEHLFIQTSTFTVESANTVEHDFFEEYDCVVDDDFWESMSNRKIKKDQREQLKEQLIQRYRDVPVRVKDQQGNFFVFKKRIRIPNDDQPTYFRVPPDVSRAWVKHIQPFKSPAVSAERREKYDFSGLHSHCILMNPFQHLTVEQFAELPFTYIDFGIIFIWIDKPDVPKAFKLFEARGFKYVENFCWIKLTMDNKIKRDEGQYFQKSKETLYIFRKEGKLELRHQRSADCEFEFVKPDNQKPQFVYEMIETLLPDQAYLELWAHPKQSRSNWKQITF